MKKCLLFLFSAFSFKGHSHTCLRATSALGRGTRMPVWHSQYLPTVKRLDWCTCSGQHNCRTFSIGLCPERCSRCPEHLRLCIRPDLSLSRLIAASITTTQSNPTLAQVCRAQGLWLANRTQLVEVRGHQGHPWNELADALAKHVLKHNANPCDADFHQLHCFAQADHDVKWSWMQTTHPSLAACFPPLIEQQIMQSLPHRPLSLFSLWNSMLPMNQLATPHGSCASSQPTSWQRKYGLNNLMVPDEQANAL